MKELIEQKAQELARQHAEIIERECRKTCEKFHCKPEDLTLEYHGHLDIKIKVNASHFRITNQFTYNNDIVMAGINSFEDFHGNENKQYSILENKIHDYSFSVRVIHTLDHEGIHTLNDLVKCNEEKLLRMPNLGRRSLNEIKSVLSDLGLTLNWNNT